VFKGPQEAWSPVEVGKKESWNRTASNAVTVKHGAKQVVFQSSGEDDFIVTEEGVFNGTDCVGAFLAAEAKA